MKRSQSAGETDKQTEHHQGEQGEDGWARIRGSAGNEAFALELAYRFGVGRIADRLSFSAVGEGARRVALFRTASVTHQGTQAVFVSRTGAVGRPIQACWIIASWAVFFTVGVALFAFGAALFAPLRRLRFVPFGRLRFVPLGGFGSSPPPPPPT